MNAFSDTMRRIATADPARQCMTDGVRVVCTLLLFVLQHSGY